jgi:hypothetical protein
VLNFSDDDVDEEIRRRLVTATRIAQRGEFSVVHPAPRTPAQVPDEPGARLVVLGPEYPHSAKSTESPGRLAVQRFLDERAGGARRYRNMLVFLCPDETRLVELRQAVRDFLAWKSIEADRGSLNLDAFQSKQAETKRGQFDDAVTQRVSETYIWALVPMQLAEEPTVNWDETRVSGPDPLAVRVGKKLRSEEGLITEYSGVRLRIDLDRVPLWRGDSVSLRELWNDYTQYLYLPRLRDSQVFLEAVRQGVALLTWDPETFAYASAYDEDNDRYRGLVGGELAAVVLDSESLLVKPERAARQLGEISTQPKGHQDGDQGGSVGGTDGETGGKDQSDTLPPKLPHRFYGRVAVDPVRMLRDIGDITDGIVAQLGRADANVAVTVEIEAASDKGFTDEVRRTINENAQTLKFQSHEFEEG